MSTKLKDVTLESIQDALDVYGWSYNPDKKEVISYDESYDKEWSEYLIAEVLLNHGDKGDLTILEDISFSEMLERLKNHLVEIPKLATNYVKMGKEWLNNEYGEYKGKTTEMDIEENSNEEDIRNELEKEIRKIEDVYNVGWNKTDYGYTLWIKFA